MKKEVSEEDLLKVFVEEMEASGLSRKLVRFDINASMVEKINNKKGTNIDLEQLYKLADRCLANEWLEHTVLSGDRYAHLSITATGLGIVRSRRHTEEVLATKTWLKKASDFIENHKGLLLFLGTVIALITLLIKLFSRQ